MPDQPSAGEVQDALETVQRLQTWAADNDRYAVSAHARGSHRHLENCLRRLQRLPDDVE